MSRRLSGRLRSLALLLSGPAHAQEVDVGKLNNQAIELSKQGEYEKAARIWLSLLDKLGPDYKHAWVFHKNVGRNFQKLNRYPLSWWHLDRCLMLTRGDSKHAKKWVNEVEKALERKHVKIRLEVEPPGEQVRLGEGADRTWYKAPLTWWFLPGKQSVEVRAEAGEPEQMSFRVASEMEVVKLSLPRYGSLVVLSDKEYTEIFVAGEPAGKGRVELKLKEGEYRLEARAEGFEPWVKDAVITGGGMTREEVVLKPVPGIEKPVTVEAEVPPWKWFVLGGAAALAAGGGVTFYMASVNLDDQRSKHDKWFESYQREHGESPKPADVDADWNDRVDTHVQPLAITSYLLWGAAGAAAITGAILLYPHLTATPSSPDDGPVGFISPIYLPSGGGFSATWQF